MRPKRPLDEQADPASQAKRLIQPPPERSVTLEDMINASGTTSFSSDLAALLPGSSVNDYNSIVPNLSVETPDDDLLGIWNQIMQESGGNSMDLLQGMMAMPSTTTATDAFSGYVNEENLPWWR
jgi:hypothetical protein